MTIPFWCLLFVLLLPYAMTIASVRYRKAQFGNSDNNQPREQSAALTGAGARI